MKTFIGMAGRQGWRPDNGEKTWHVLRWLLLDTYVPVTCYGGYESVMDGCTDCFNGPGKNWGSGSWFTRGAGLVFIVWGLTRVIMA